MALSVVHQGAAAPPRLGFSGRMPWGSAVLFEELLEPGGAASEAGGGCGLGVRVRLKQKPGRGAGWCRGPQRCPVRGLGGSRQSRGLGPDGWCMGEATPSPEAAVRPHALQRFLRDRRPTPVPGPPNLPSPWNRPVGPLLPNPAARRSVASQQAAPWPDPFPLIVAQLVDIWVVSSLWL